MHLQVRVDAHDILDDREQVGGSRIDIEVLQRCIARGVIEAVYCSQTTSELAQCAGTRSRLDAAYH